VLPWRGQVTVVAIREGNRERLPQRAPGLDLQAGAREHLARGRRDAERANPDGLEFHWHGGGEFRHFQRFAGIDLPAIGESRWVGGGGPGLLGPLQPRCGRPAHRELQLALLHGQRNPRRVLDRSIHAQRLGGDGIRHLLDSLIGRQRARWLRHVDAVDVAAGAVGHDADERRVLAVRAEERLQPVGKRSKIIRADRARSGAADVMQSVVRQHRQRTTVRVLHGEDVDLRVDFVRGAEEARAAGGRIHLHAVGRFPERIGHARLRLEQPAPVEHEFRFPA
jgi:hypothetical protein